MPKYTGTILLTYDFELEIWLLGYFYRQSPMKETNLPAQPKLWESHMVSVIFTVCFFQ